MGAGVNGGAMVVAVDLVVEAINTGTDLAAPHLPNMEETLALVHRPNQLCAMTIVVQVRKCEKRYQILHICGFFVHPIEFCL